MRIFMTGGGGYLAGCLIRKLLNRNYSVTVLDNLTYKQDGLVQFCNNKNFKFVYGDVRNHKLLSTLSENCDVIIPLAAIVGMPACEKDHDLATSVNFLHVKHLVDLSNGKKIIFPNTNSSYGSKVDGECTEETETKPLSHYAVTKCKAEDYILSNSNGIALRLATVFGAMSTRLRLDLLVNDFVYKACTDGYLVLFEKHFKRNYIHIEDVANAFLFMLDNYEKCKNNIFNVGLSSANLTKFELAEKIKEFIPNLVIHVDEFKKDFDQRNYQVSNKKIESFGWKPTHTIEDGIREMIQACKILSNVNTHYTNL